MDSKLIQEKVWQGFGIDEAERYWTNRLHKKRSKWFASMLTKYDFESIYEIGVNCGRNLDYVLRFMPDKIVGGLDINEDILEFAKEHVPSANLDHCSIYDMDIDSKHDIVFTSGILLHIPPKEVRQIISGCIKKANKYVMHMETQGKDKIINGPKEFNPTKKISRKLRCVHNYVKIYHELGYAASVKTIPEFSESDAQHIIIVEV